MSTLPPRQGREPDPTPDADAAVSEVASTPRPTRWSSSLSPPSFSSPSSSSTAGCLGRVSNKIFSSHFALYTPRDFAMAGDVPCRPHDPRALVSRPPYRDAALDGAASSRSASSAISATPITTCSRPTRRSARARFTLPDEWRLVGPVIAISGLFTFGWTGLGPGLRDGRRPAGSTPSGARKSPRASKPQRSGDKA